MVNSFDNFDFKFITHNPIHDTRFFPDFFGEFVVDLEPEIVYIGSTYMYSVIDMLGTCT